MGMEIETWYYKNEKRIEIFLWLFLIIWRIPFLNKGIDYTDTGFALSNYSNVFSGGGINSIGVFYTTLIGGILYALLPFGQLLIFRILHWMIGLFTMYLTWRLMRVHVNGNIILLAFICMSFSLKSGEAVFGYYNLSGLTTIIMIVLLYYGLVKDRIMLIFLAGFVAGINAFVRLPNVLFFLASFCIIWYGICTHRNKRDVAKQFGIAVLGAVVSFIITFLLMICFMGWTQVADSFMKYVNIALGQPTSTVTNFLGIDEVSGHSLYAEVRTIAYQGWKSIVVFALIVCLPVFGSLVIRIILEKFGKEKRSRFIGTIAMLICGLSIMLFLNLNFNITTVPSWMRGLLSVFLSVILLFRWKSEKAEYSLLCMLNVILSLTTIWGSDGGLSRFSIIGQFQLAVLLLCVKRFCERISILENNYSKDKVMRQLAPAFKDGAIEMIGMTLLFSILMGVISLPIVYNDTDITNLQYSVSDDIPLFWGMKTSDVRAEEINQYYELMNCEEIADKEVAIFGYWALGEVIGPQESYFESVQPCIDYAGVDVVSLLEVIEEKEEKEIVPVIVVSMVDAIQREMDSANVSEAKQAVLEYMLSLHDYEVFAETEYFTVYVAIE